MNKGYGHQMWAAKTLKDSHLVEAVNPCYSDLH